MARILFTTQPMAGHVRPGLAVARHLVAAGHEVSWYTGRKYRGLVAATGARFVAYPAELDWDDAGLGAAAAPAGLRGLEQSLIDLFVTPIPAHASALAQIIDETRPQVLVAESGFMAGPAAAELRGIPRVVYTVTPLGLSSVDVAPFGTCLPPSTKPLGRLRNRTLNWAFRNVLFARAQRAALAARAALGLPRLPGYFMDWSLAMSDRFLHGSVPELEYPRRDLPSKVEFVGAMVSPAVDEWTAPAWWPELVQAHQDRRPVVLVTQGTVAMDYDKLLRPAVAALATEDVLVVATTVGAEPHDVIAERPANLRVERFIPFTELLPMVDVMVTNGGFGGVQTAFSHGVPVVGAGTTEDKGEVNARVQWAGAGISLRTDRPTVAQIRAAVATVLADGSYRAGARRLQRAYACHGGAARAAEVVLEGAGLTARRQYRHTNA